MSKPPPQKTLEHTLALILMLASFACERPQEAEPPPPTPPASEANAQPPNPVGALDVKPDKPPNVQLRMEKRVDAEGYPFAIVGDGSGNHLIVSQKGRKAAYFLESEPVKGQALPSVSFETAPGAPFVLGPGRFAFPLPEENALVFLGNQPKRAPADRLVIERRLEVKGVPAALFTHAGVLWLIARDAPEGKGLLGLELTPDAIAKRYTTGPSPVELVLFKTGPRASAVLVTSRTPERPGEGQVHLLRLTEGLPSEELLTLEVPGEPGLVVPHPEPGFAWVLREGETVLLRLDLEKGSLEEGPSLGILPTRLISSGTRVWALDARGKLARFEYEGHNQLPRHAHVEVGAGASEMVFVDGEGLFVLERQRVLWLDAQTLEVLATLDLPSRSGRMQLDARRRRLVITLPQHQEVAVVAY